MDEKKAKPKLLASERLYQGRVFDVEAVSIQEGEISYRREIIKHRGSAVIVPVFADGTVALVRQYRHAAQKFLLEIPAGTLENDETPETGARRELEEEIGVRAGNIEKLTEFYVSPGFLTEKMYVFLATDLKEAVQNFDEDEIIEVERFTFHELFEKIRNGEIEDAKTMVSLILAGAKFEYFYR